MAEFHSRQYRVVAYAVGDVDAAFLVYMCHELAAIHLRGVAVVVVVVEERAPFVYPVGKAGALLCRFLVLVSQHASF